MKKVICERGEALLMESSETTQEQLEDKCKRGKE